MEPIRELSRTQFDELTIELGNIGLEPEVERFGNSGLIKLSVYKERETRELIEQCVYFVRRFRS